MQTITKQFFTDHTETYLLPHRESYLFFDIETTGFSRDHTILYLIGCGYYKKDSFHFFQWFNDDGFSEKEILSSFLQVLEKKDWNLMTFNGNSFDIPYLQHHYELHGISCSFDQYTSIDFYHFLKPFQNLFHMIHGKQKDWERFLGKYREDHYDGGQLIAVYKKYLLTQNPELLHNLLLHNEEDLLGMKCLLPLLSYPRLLSGDFTIRTITPDVMDGKESSGKIHVGCTLSHPLPREMDFDSSAGQIYGKQRTIRISIPFYEGELKYFYKDYQDYYYLPKEDRAIHKSVGRYVDKKYRKQAKASTCYIKKEGIFLPLPHLQKHFGFQITAAHYQKKFPLYKRVYKDKHYFARFDDLFSFDNRFLTEYLCNVIKEIFITSLQESAM